MAKASKHFGSFFMYWRLSLFVCVSVARRYVMSKLRATTSSSLIRTLTISAVGYSRMNSASASASSGRWSLQLDAANINAAITMRVTV